MWYCSLISAIDLPGTYLTLVLDRGSMIDDRLQD